MPLVRIENLQVGMLIGEDIFSAYGSILVNAGDRLDVRTLDKLRMHRIKMAKVIDEDNTHITGMAKTVQTVNPVVLQVFSRTYDHKAEEVQNVFEQVACSLDPDAPPIDETLTEITTDIMGAIGDQKDIVRYIHKMKQTSPSIFTHSINVSILCNLFGTLLDYPEDKKNNLTLAGLLHDIGKAELGIDVQQNSLNADQMEQEQIEKYKKHSTLSYRILMEKGLPKDVCLGVLMHHETEAGTGFPTGAKWSQIHEYAKIIAIANFYDHMTFSGDTRKNVNPFAVIKLLETLQYNKFDIQFVSTFLKRMATYYLNEWVELTSDEIGQIVFINQNDLSHPIVKIGNALVDLSREPDIDIRRIL